MNTMFPSLFAPSMPRYGAGVPASAPGWGGFQGGAAQPPSPGMAQFSGLAGALGALMNPAATWRFNAAAQPAALNVPTAQGSFAAPNTAIPGLGAPTAPASVSATPAPPPLPSNAFALSMLGNGWQNMTPQQLSGMGIQTLVGNPGYGVPIQANTSPGVGGQGGMAGATG